MSKKGPPPQSCFFTFSTFVSTCAKDGHIVVAAVYGEMVVKRLKMISGAMVLVSEQVGYEPIAVNEMEDCYIWGVVTGSARTLL